MISEGLGRIYNIRHNTAAGTWLTLRDAAALTYLVHEVDGGTVISVAFANDSAGTGATSPLVIDHYYGMSADVANGVWHRNNITAAAGFTKPDGTDDVVAIEILETMCPTTAAGVKQQWVRITVDGAATATAVFHDLGYPRAPQNLRSVSA